MASLEIGRRGLPNLTSGRACSDAHEHDEISPNRRPSQRRLLLRGSWSTCRLAQVDLVLSDLVQIDRRADPNVRPMRNIPAISRAAPITTAIIESGIPSAGGVMPPGPEDGRGALATPRYPSERIRPVTCLVAC